jgi:hypothetical protein
MEVGQGPNVGYSAKEKKTVNLYNPMGWIFEEDAGANMKVFGKL